MNLWLNGKVHPVSDPQEPLLQLLRRTGLTAAKEGCGEGECGACLVAIERVEAEGRPRFIPVNACLLPAGALAGERIITVEGIAPAGELHPVQEALVATGGSQCGYCTPGFVMALFTEYYRPGRDGFERESLSGNLCRCTGYRPIVAAGEALGAPSADDPWLEERGGSVGAAAVAEIDPVPIEPVFRPTTLPELFILQQAHPEASLLAGGTDLGVELSLRGRRFPALISLDRIAELQAVTEGADSIDLGAAVPLTELRQRLGARIPLLAQLFPLFASLPIRNRATLGGNLATASPIGDAPPALLALDAELRLVSESGERLLDLADFFLGYRRTALAPGELIAAVRIPLRQPSRAHFYKVAKRQEDDIATVSAAFAIDLSADGLIERARLAFGGVAATPVRAVEVERFLTGRPWSEATVAQAAHQLTQAFQPLTDHRGSAAYRQALLGSLLQKFFHESGGGAR